MSTVDTPASRIVAAALAVVLLVSLAGCNGPWNGDDGDRDPYDVDRTPPGLTSDAVVSSYDLVGAHYDALDGRAYTMNYTRITTDGNGSTTSVHEVETRVEADGRTALVDRTVTVTGSTADGAGETESNGTRTEHYASWTEEGTTLTRVNDSGDVEYIVDDLSTTPTLPVDHVGAYEAVDTVTDTGDRYVLTGTAEELGPYENASFEFVLTSDGYVSECTLDAETSNPDEVVEVTTEIERHGGLDLTEPDWIDEARAAIESTER